ncbi:MAG: Glu/Leu/Phe/Val dehydrogenase [Candidatus Harrisonbacteria bacterium CG10_big_fil_rev_8_21_14_0_10_38_8]|uniref:Glutamate dehydrogenase n=1 Tax=Candidatus Harrisonbacteria bacterium CG10_big_fil_rev_8_21_14_0_10_38_8 TaxID=1974582 RepID=A0A2M6WKA9_9BACT|nr:MAG: Glu/Leu/Phe/Val dehydrogenase [Candidatus Harrisonbacteria bacterium CG10_big_fil_rev_8_21_14_0_10_38_8]
MKKQEKQENSINYDDIGPELVIETHDPKLGFKGVLVIDNTKRGMGKGGIRMSLSADSVEVSRLARAMTYKNALANLPFGGAKSGITIDGKNLTKENKKKIVQSFAKAIKPFVPHKYIAAPDINMGENEMKWFVEATGEWESITGKPADFCSVEKSPTNAVKKGKKRCGLPHELGSTGYGVALSAIVAAEFIGKEIKDMRVSIAGYGNVGTFAHKFLQEKGAKIIAVSDSSGTIFNRDGIDYEDLIKVKTKTGSVNNYKDATKLTSNVIYTLTTDILIPAAGSDVINKENIKKIKAEIIIQGANIPMADEEEKYLHDRKTIIVPDIIANAGGVISSYAEYVGMNEKQMFNLVEKKIIPNVKEILKTSRAKKITPRKAALQIARKRILGK